MPLFTHKFWDPNKGVQMVFPRAVFTAIDLLNSRHKDWQLGHLQVLELVHPLLLKLLLLSLWIDGKGLQCRVGICS